MAHSTAIPRWSPTRFEVLREFARLREALDVRALAVRDVDDDVCRPGALLFREDGGEGANVESLAKARELAKDFNRVGDHLGMAVECAITNGGAPVGRGVGPVLEAREVLATLAGGGPNDLRVKAIRLADLLFESVGVDADAAEILDSGQAEETFREILAAQNGDPDVEAADLSPGRHTVAVRADRDGVVTHVNNRLVNEVARRAGAPRDPGAGLELHRRVGEMAASGETLFTVHAESEDKLADAKALTERVETVRVRHPDEALVERV
jgi:AMP phosphorylase